MFDIVPEGWKMWAKFVHAYQDTNEKGEQIEEPLRQVWWQNLAYNHLAWWKYVMALNTEKFNPDQ